MRFFADGPAIPDDLLFARDEGQVLFFCGSGVSLARSGLPDFYGLAAAVIASLGAAATSRACAVVEASKRVGPIDGLGGLIAADRVFSMLEEEFETRLVRKEVARALREKYDDLSAHRLILDLARGTDGEVRLVTTNFDTLFERCNPAIVSHCAPDFPDPHRTDQFTGIVHLHGRITDDYGVPEGEEFVLSSGDFGRAYLSEGWATRFISSLLERYQIVFLGYTADDPPVQYLLEALRRSGRPLNQIYAFQAGKDEHAKALWRHRGVEAIAYDPADRHRALWDTLEAWAARARDPGAWNKAVLAKAMAGPVDLAPFERGQVANVISSPIGAALLEDADYRLPAEWLCVFEADMRYSEPGRRTFDPDSDVIDPFELWNIDSDEVPAPFVPDERCNERKVPESAWRAFARRRQDRVPENDGSAFYGNASEQVRSLPRRLERMGRWLASVAHDPTTLWWAAGRGALHPHVSNWISNALEQGNDDRFALHRRGWRYLLEERSARLRLPREVEIYGLEAQVRQDGWSQAVARRLGDFRRPHLEIYRALGARTPPKELTRLSEVLHFQIVYPDADVLRDVPAGYLEIYVRHLELAVGHACDLHEEHYAGSYALNSITQSLDLAPFPAPEGTSSNLTGLVQAWMYHVTRLGRDRPQSASASLSGWRQRAETPFVRARICALSMPEFVDAATSAEIVSELSDDAFWSRSHQADLLRGLVRRWAELSEDARIHISNRILQGPEDPENDRPEEMAVRRAYRSLERIAWFKGKGCALAFDVDAELARLAASVPSWSKEWAEDADDSGSRVPRETIQNDDPAELARLPADRILAKADEIMAKRGEGGSEYRPFAGLSEQHSYIALDALECRKAGEHQWAWPTFLGSAARLHDDEELRCRTARALLNLNDDEFTRLTRTVCHWLESAHLVLVAHDTAAFADVWTRILRAFQRDPEVAKSGIVRTGGERDWAMEAINSPPGQLAKLAIESALKDGAGGEIDPIWLRRLGDLLDFPGDSSRYALVQIVFNIRYLNRRSPQWVTNRVLSRRELDAETRAAFWSSIFRADALSIELTALLGSEFTGIVAEHDNEAWRQPCASFLLNCWGNAELRAGGLAVRDEELRKALLSASERLRLYVLQICRNRMARPDSKWIIQAEELIRNVWPRQLEARSSATSIELLRYALDSGDKFGVLATIIEDLIGPIDGGFILGFPVKEAIRRAETDSAQLLRLLIRMLPEDAARWPFRVEQILEALASGPSAADRNLQELRRRWAAR